MVETLRHVTGHFNVLNLVAANRDFMRFKQQNISAHQHRVHEKTGRDVGVRVVTRSLVFIDRCLVGMGAVEHAFTCYAGQQPAKLRNFRNIRLPIEHDTFRV